VNVDDGSVRPGPTDLGDRWDLPVGRTAGERVGGVDQLRVDFAFTLVISTVLEIRIETAFSVTSAGVEVVFDPEDTRSLGPLLDLHEAGVLAATLSKTGTLRVEFQDGRSLRVEPDDRYEACTVQLRAPGGDRRFEFIVLPGGGLAEFDFTSRAGGR
jgi:hypothetical protein